MSLLPILLDELLEHRRSPSCDLFDQNFGLGLNLFEPRPSSLSMYVPLRSGYLRPWRTMSADNSGVSSVQNTKDGFRVNLDVQQFKPDELKVKVVDDFLVVEAKHEERSDEHGFISREFTRRYKLPENVDTTALISKLSSDGVLTLEAPKKGIPDSKVREIPITHTNAPAVKNKTQEKQPEKMEDN